MKKLFVWLASVSTCAAQAMSIGPFATEGWVEERLHVLTNDFATVTYVDDLVSEIEEQIPDVSGLATKEYVDAVSNAIPSLDGLATVEQVVAVSNLIPDTVSFATREWVGQEITNAVDDLLDGDGYIMTNLVSGSSLVDKSITGDKLANNAVNGAIIANLSVSTGKLTNKAVTTAKLADNAVTKDKIDGSVTNWLATTNWVLDIVSSATPGNYSEVSNRAMQAVISESDPTVVLSNRTLFVRNDSIEIPSGGGIAVEYDPVFTNWLATTNVVISDKGDWTDGSSTIPASRTVYADSKGDDLYTEHTGDIPFFSPYYAVTVDSKGDFYTHKGTEWLRLVYCNNKGDAFFPNSYDDSIYVHDIATVYPGDDPGVFLLTTPAFKGSTIELALKSDIPSTNGFIKTEVDPAFTNWLASVYPTNRVEQGSNYKMSIAQNGTVSLTPQWKYASSSSSSEIGGIAGTVAVVESENDIYSSNPGAVSIKLYKGYGTYSQTLVYHAVGQVSDPDTPWNVVTNCLDNTDACHWLPPDGKFVFVEYPDNTAAFLYVNVYHGGVSEEAWSGFPSSRQLKTKILSTTDDGVQYINVCNFVDDSDGQPSYSNLRGTVGIEMVGRSGHTAFISSIPTNKPQIVIGTIEGTNAQYWVEAYAGFDGTIPYPEPRLFKQDITVPGALSAYANDTGFITTNANGTLVLTYKGNTANASTNSINIGAGGCTLSGSNNSILFGDGGARVYSSASSLFMGHGSGYVIDSPYSAILSYPGVSVTNTPNSFIFGSGSGATQISNSEGLTLFGGSGGTIKDSKYAFLAGGHMQVDDAISSIAFGHCLYVTNTSSFLWNSTPYAISEYRTWLSYSVGDFAVYSNKVYRCIAAANEETFDPSKWVETQYSPVLQYGTHGPGTFNINPVGGAAGVWIGETNLATYLQNAGGGGGGTVPTLPLSVANGGTGATTAKDARDNLGAVNRAGDTMTGGLTVPNLTVGNREYGSTVGEHSVAEGADVLASGDCSHAEGNNTCARGDSSHAEGFGSIADGNYTHAEGRGTKTLNEAEHAQGRYNASHTGSTDAEKTIHSIGVGARLSPRNAVEVMFDGKVFVKGVGGYDGTNPTTATNLATYLDCSSKIALDAIAPAFGTSSVYTNGDYVIYERHLYECTNYTGQAGWRANDWQQTTVTEILGNLRKILDEINGEAL